jgi:predicted GIY-YIG superfamily endonuclease
LLGFLGGSNNATEHCVRSTGARFVYILRSETDPSRHYVGRSSNPDERLKWHNDGPSGYTLQHRPWRLIVSIAFPDESAASRFERYLKSGSGRAFAKRHFALT